MSIDDDRRQRTQINTANVLPQSNHRSVVLYTVTNQTFIRIEIRMKV